MDKTNILYLIIGFLAGFAIGVPVLAALMKQTVAFIVRHVAVGAIDDLEASALRSINETTVNAKIAFSEAHSGITKSAADTFDYLSKLITPESINTAYGLNEPPVGYSLNVPNKTRALAADLVRKYQDNKEPLKPSDAPDTFFDELAEVQRRDAIDRQNKDIFDGEIVSGVDFPMNLTVFENVGRVGVFKAGIDYAIARAVFDNRQTTGFTFGDDFAGILTCYIVYELDAVFPKVIFAYLPNDEVFADNVIEQIAAHLARELNTSGVLESFKFGGAK